MMLGGKIAIVYGGGGAVGGAVARAFAREGAQVHLAGRTAARLAAVADDIRAAGGAAETAVVDALDESAVDRHAATVAADAGAIDISFNLIACGEVQGTPLLDMSLADFERPIVNRIRTHFLTARAAARHMVAQGAGVILTFGGRGLRDPIRDYYSGGYQVYLGGTQVGFGAIDVLRRQLACELGPRGVRVVTLESGGVPETIADEGFRRILTESFAGSSMLKHAETLDDVGNVAAFAASDLARSMTATSFNITYGRAVDA
ncbi:MAG TPA: SDR family oxidoreductase [Acidimicrobiia bacterium]|nr:SDR family oxidoreductase [Acidimicrobiia bacterium]